MSASLPFVKNTFYEIPLHNAVDATKLQVSYTGERSGTINKDAPGKEKTRRFVLAWMHSREEFSSVERVQIGRRWIP